MLGQLGHNTGEERPPKAKQSGSLPWETNIKIKHLPLFPLSLTGHQHGKAEVCSALRQAEDPEIAGQLGQVVADIL